MRRKPGARITPRAWQKFLVSLAQTRTVMIAARVAGIGYKTVYRRRQLDPAFREAFDNARTRGQLLEAEAWRRVVAGVNVPVLPRRAPPRTYRHPELDDVPTQSEVDDARERLARRLAERAARRRAERGSGSGEPEGGARS